MRSAFALLLMFLFVPGCEKVKEIVKENNLKNAREEKTLPGKGTADVIICGIGVEATIDPGVWKNYLEKNLVLDSTALDTIPAGTYNVFVQFVIDNKGRVGDVSVLKDPGHGLGQKAVKVISRYEGLWEPARENNRATFSYRIQPITFIVEEDEKCEDELPAGSIL